MMAAFAGLLGPKEPAQALADSFARSYPDYGQRYDIAAATLLVEDGRSSPLQVRDARGVTWHVLADGRLDDRAHLAQALNKPGTTGDQELLAAAFARWGEAFPSRIVGTFAFMAWCPADECLLLVRDPVGGVPIFHHLSADGFAFAIDLPVLLRLPHVSGELRLEMLAGLLGRSPSLTGSGSFYRDIPLLPVGHMLRWEKGRVSIRQWWTPPPVQRREQPAEALRALVTAAVEDRLRGGRQCAVLLSGGLDSSAIACLAARRLKRDGRRLLVISSVLPDGWSGPESDERPWIEAVLAQEDNIDIHWVREGRERAPFSALPQALDLLGYPPCSNVSHMETALAEAARRHGADRVLSGFGGDFFASSKPNLFPLALLCEGEGRAALRELLAMRRRQSWPALLRGEILSPLVRSILSPSRDFSIPGPALRPLLRRRWRPWSQDIPQIATVRRQMAFLLEPGRMELTLNGATQIFRRLFGQSLVFPLLDRRIVEFMLSLPGRQIRQDGQPRFLFRQAMAGILPETIRQRFDKGPAFDPIIAARLVAHREALAAWATETTVSPCWDIVNLDSFQQALARLKASDRAGWRAEMFQSVLQGGLMAHFVQWHHQNRGCP